jgi:hypothetical protein
MANESRIVDLESGFRKQTELKFALMVFTYAFIPDVFCGEYREVA